MDTGKLLTFAAIGVGGWWVYENFFATPVSNAAPGATVPTSPSSAPIGTTPDPGAVSASGPVLTPSTPGTLAALWTKVQAAVLPDATYQANGGKLTAFGWNYYLSSVQGGAPVGYEAGTWPPDPAQVFGSTAAASVPMTGSQYWAAMQQALAAQGLSGLLAGLGCFDCGLGQTVDISDQALDIADFNASGAVALLDPNAGPNFTGGVAIAGQPSLTQSQVSFASPQLAASWFSQNAGTVALIAALVVGAFVIMPNYERGRR